MEWGIGGMMEETDDPFVPSNAPRSAFQHHSSSPSFHTTARQARRLRYSQTILHSDFCILHFLPQSEIPNPKSSI
jgi:hypothetical protein